MPIQPAKKARDPTDEVIAAIEEDETLTLDSVEDVIRSYIYFNQNPSEDEREALRGLFDLTKPEFLTMFNRLSLEEDDEELEEVEDDLDAGSVFLVTYLMHNPDPSEMQQHLLAAAVKMTPEQLEQRLSFVLERFFEDDIQP